MYKYIKSSFKRELLFSFILVTILPLIISSFFMIRVFKMKIETIEQKEIISHASNIEKLLLEFFQKINQVSHDISKDQMIINALKDNKEEDLIMVHQGLFNYTSEIRNLAKFEIYSKEGICKFSTNTRALDTAIPTYWGILKEIEDKPDSFIMRNEKGYFNGNTDINLKAARTIVDKFGNQVGYIVVGIKNSAFAALLNDTNSLKDTVAILDKNWDIIYDVGKKNDKFFGEVLRKRFIMGEDVNQFIKENNIFISPLGDTGMFLLLQRDAFFTSDISKAMINIVIIMVVFSLLLSTLVSLKISKELFKPIHITNDAMHKVEEGDLNTRIETGRYDEFGKLAINFNAMVDKIQDYMDNKVKQQKELNESNIAMMQAQLNPHFIYNTLDTIKWVAKANNIPKIVTLVTGLAKILRTSISSNQLITLNKELITVKNYIEIQQLRFNNKFKVTLDISKDVEKFIVPKLSIQPLVENSIIHGLADCEKGHIHILAKTKKDILIINVIDDGCGIDDETLNILNGNIEEKEKKGIGVYNIDKIIKLRYGDSFGVFFSKMEDGGTKATIILPAIIQEEI